jgi:hypothetical protein
LCTVAVLGLAGLAGAGEQLTGTDPRTGEAPPAQPAAKPPPAEGTCGGYGTSVDFLDTPSAAARKAKKEQKLVFVLHVSGNFEDPRFT